MMFQLNIDVTEELRYLLPSKYDLIVASIVLDELSNLKKTAKGQNKLAASMAYKQAQMNPFKILEMTKDDHVDNILLKYCIEHPCSILCTNDKKLRMRARSYEIPVVYLRQRRYLEVDGHIIK